MVVSGTPCTRMMRWVVRMITRPARSASAGSRTRRPPGSEQHGHRSRLDDRGDSRTSSSGDAGERLCGSRSRPSSGAGCVHVPAARTAAGPARRRSSGSELVDEVADAVGDVDRRVPAGVDDVRGLVGRGHDVEDEERARPQPAITTLTCPRASSRAARTRHTAAACRSRTRSYRTGQLCRGTPRRACTSHVSRERAGDRCGSSVRRRGSCSTSAGRLLLIRRGQAPSRRVVVGARRPVPTGRGAAAACVREVAEETGLRVGCCARGPGRARRRRPAAVYDIDDFVCEAVGGELAAGDDADDARWVTRAELAALDLGPAARRGAELRGGCLPRLSAAHRAGSASGGRAARRRERRCTPSSAPSPCAGRCRRPCRPGCSRSSRRALSRGRSSTATASCRARSSRRRWCRRGRSARRGAATRSRGSRSPCR